MKKNLGNIEVIIRILMAFTIVVLYATGILKGVAAVILLILAAVLVVTAFINFCPIWAMLGINTRKKSGQTGPADQ